MTKQAAALPPEDALPLAVMDFVRAIRNDDRIPPLAGDARRRRALIREHACAVAAEHGVGRAELMLKTARMISPHGAASSEDETPAAKP